MKPMNNECEENLRETRILFFSVKRKKIQIKISSYIADS